MRNKDSGMRKDIDDATKKHEAYGASMTKNEQRSGDRRKDTRRKTSASNTGGASVGGGT